MPNEVNEGTDAVAVVVAPTVTSICEPMPEVEVFKKKSTAFFICYL